MIEEDLSWVDECVTCSIHKLGWVMRDVRIKVKRVLPSSFLTQTITKREAQAERQSFCVHILWLCINCEIVVTWMSFNFPHREETL
jgi:hypothetical protein